MQPSTIEISPPPTPRTEYSFYDIISGPLTPVPSRHSDCIPVSTASPKIACPEFTTLRACLARPHHCRLDSGLRLLIFGGADGLTLCAAEDRCVIESLVAARTPPVHWAQAKAESHWSSSYCATGRALDFSAASLCPTHTELLAS